MNREDIIRMARSVGATAYTNRHYPDRPTYTFNVDQLERFAALVRAAAFDEAAEVHEPLTDEEIWKIKSDFEKYAEIKIPEKPFRHVVRTIEASNGIGEKK